MIVQVHSRHLNEATWWEFALRFVLGGLVTVAAGLIAKKYGAALGGLFLAFPAIFPASATLIEKHERRRKEEKGLQGACRARAASGADAFGAAMGSIGLIAFAVCAWQLLPQLEPVLAIAAATLAWTVVSLVVWFTWKRDLLRLRHASHSPAAHQLPRQP